MNPAEPSPELVHRVLLKLYDYCDEQRIRLRAPLTADTPIERALAITGDDVWEMLEAVASGLDMKLVDMNGPQHFRAGGGVLGQDHRAADATADCPASCVTTDL